jgi:uncharacterized protein (DUF1015 family)
MSDLDELLAKAIVAYDAMTPEERRAMHQAQARSFVIAEAGFGSDADEAAYRQALADNDTKTLARLDAEAAERQRMARTYLEQRL